MTGRYGDTLSGKISDQILAAAVQISSTSPAVSFATKRQMVLLSCAGLDHNR